MQTQAKYAHQPKIESGGAHPRQTSTEADEAKNNLYITGTLLLKSKIKET
jgi:hypothetical protein